MSQQCETNNRLPNDPRQSRRDVRDLIEKYDKQREESVARRRREYAAWLKEHQRGDNPPVTPFLLIRYAATDLGVRPIPSGVPFWSSPDIWVESSDPAGNPVAGEPNYLHARIFNLGAFQAAPVQVDFYWANPALGLGPASMNFIGREWVEVASLSSVDVRCNTAWVPVVVNDGHECVMVNCSNWILDPILQPFQPTLDRHVGQRNLHVVEGKPGMKIKLSLQIANHFPLELATFVTLAFDHLAPTVMARQIPFRDLAALAAMQQASERFPPQRLAGLFRRQSQAHRTAQRSLALARRNSQESPQLFRRIEETRSAVSVNARLSDEYGVLSQSASAKYGGDLLAALDVFRQKAEGLEETALIRNLRLEPFSFRKLDLEVGVPADARKGEFIVVHLAQRAGPVTMGGYAVVVHVV